MVKNSLPILAACTFAEASMLKFLGGLIVGLFLGAYLVTSFPHELAKILAWTSLVTML